MWKLINGNTSLSILVETGSIQQIDIQDESIIFDKSENSAGQQTPESKPGYNDTTKAVYLILKNQRQ